MSTPQPAAVVGWTMGTVADLRADEYLPDATEGWGFVSPSEDAQYWDHYWRNGAPICRPWTPPNVSVVYLKWRSKRQCPYCEAELVQSPSNS